MAVSVIPPRLGVGNEATCLGPAEILQLAVLGGAARGAVQIDDLIATTQSLGGGFWQPTSDVIVTCLESLEARALLAIENPPASASVVRLSVSGFDYLAVLMRRDMRDVPEPLFHCLLGIKIALIELLSHSDRQRQIEALISRLEGVVKGIRKTKNSRLKQYDHLTTVIDFEETRLRCEIGWLHSLRDAESTVVAMRP